MSPERQQEALNEVRAFMGDDMAARIAQVMQAHASGGIASSQPVIFTSVQTSQQSWGTPVMQPMGQIAGPPVEPVTQRSSGIKWLLAAGLLVGLAACLMVAGIAGFVILR
jgi:hypothetical protein